MLKCTQCRLLCILLEIQPTRENTPLLNANIRKALAMAFDKQAYADVVLQNGSIPANGLVPEKLALDPSTGKITVNKMAIF